MKFPLVFAVLLLLSFAAHAAERESAFDRVLRTGTLRCGYFVMDSLLTKDLKTGKMGGPGYDIITAMAKNLSLKVEWVQEAGFASMGNDLNTGRYDMVCAPVVPNGPRARVMSMSRTVFSQPVTIWLHKDDPRLVQKDPSWLNAGMTKFISVDGTAFTTLIENFFPQAAIVALPELTPVSDMYLELKGRKVDAMLMTTYNAVKFAEKNEGIVHQYTDRIVNYPTYQFPLPQGDAKMQSMVNMALQELVYNGVIDAVLGKYDPEKIYYKRPLAE